jgi:lipopolysaccharide transport system ATP-binding protein
MSSDIAIRVEGLGKCYPIYSNPRDRLLQMIVRGRKKFYKEFWALRGVSFEIKRGETVGVIGRNGSGKSTMLQLICGTLAPTTGRVEVSGRVAALLELGAGFNPEFTGRENVYTAGSLYGLDRSEIERRFDDIAAFADIGEFMDQPVKMYSSGMFVRLAFAVVSHVDADILIVDEALSVGDAVFTQKCMRFIRRFQEDGTLVFVSHDMGSIVNLCKKALWLSAGLVQKIGEAKTVTRSYLKSTLQEFYGDKIKLAATETEHVEGPTGSSGLAESKEGGSPIRAVDQSTRVTVENNVAQASGWKTGAAEILSVNLKKLGSLQDQVFFGGERVRLEIRARANQRLERPILGFLVRDRLGQDLFGENTLPFTDQFPTSIDAGEEFEGRFTFSLPLLPNGEYAVMTSVADGELASHVQHHWLHDALILRVLSPKVRWGLVGIPFEEVALLHPA